MPTYDYVCEACNHKFELFQSMMDPVQRKCPQCKKSKLRRLFGTGAAVMFKGSGFYQTDYRSDSYKKGASADSADNGNRGNGESKAPKSSEGAAASGKSEPSGKSEGSSGASSPKSKADSSSKSKPPKKD
jgi:putative FmdB family regulatory protein